MLGVSEAASELGVSPRRVRQMLADGVLAGDRVGRAWVIDSKQLQRACHRRPPVGRPWRPVSAWSVLALADGGKMHASPVQRSRARARLALGLDHVAERLGTRADRRWFYAHPGVMARLATAPELVLAGISASADHQVGLVAGDGFEGYVRAGQVDDVVKQFGLDDQSARPNVLLRVVDDDVWPFENGQSAASRAVVAVDLLESHDPRARRAGVELWESHA